MRCQKQDVFEGGQRGGEHTESAYLQRAFDGFEAIRDKLPHWAQVLYGDLLRHLGAMDGVD